MIEYPSAELLFARWDDLTRIIHFLGQKERAEERLNRLMLAGFVRQGRTHNTKTFVADGIW